MDKYAAPASRLQHEIEIKRSRFITTIDYCESRQQAQQVISDVRLQMPSANHHCWAMVAGNPDNDFLIDQSDDGEPHGTAGKPILNVLRYSLIGNIVAIVSRYFGGIKLGTGGLARAYSQSANDGIKLLTLKEIEITEIFYLEFTYDLQSRLDNFLTNQKIVVAKKFFGAHIDYQINVPLSLAPLIESKLTDLCHGHILIKK